MQIFYQRIIAMTLQMSEIVCWTLYCIGVWIHWIPLNPLTI